MPYYKSEYNAEGHNVTVQQVNESGSPSLWIDGYGQSIDTARDVLAESGDELAQEIFDKMSHEFDAGDSIEAVETLATYLVSTDQYICTKCESLYPAENVVQTHFAGHKCKACKTSDNTCDDGGDHDMECVNPRQKHNARLSTKYKCKKCGYTRKTTPTG